MHNFLSSLNWWLFSMIFFSCTVSCIAVHTRSSTKSSSSVCLCRAFTDQSSRCNASAAWSRLVRPRKATSLLLSVPSLTISVSFKSRKLKSALSALLNVHARESPKQAAKWLPSTNWLCWHRPERTRSWSKASVPPVRQFVTSEELLVFHTRTPNRTCVQRDASSRRLAVVVHHAATRNKQELLLHLYLDYLGSENIRNIQQIKENLICSDKIRYFFDGNESGIGFAFFFPAIKQAYQSPKGHKSTLLPLFRLDCFEEPNPKMNRPVPCLS